MTFCQTQASTKWIFTVSEATTLPQTVQVLPLKLWLTEVPQVEQVPFWSWEAWLQVRPQTEQLPKDQLWLTVLPQTVHLPLWLWLRWLQEEESAL